MVNSDQIDEMALPWLMFPCWCTHYEYYAVVPNSCALNAMCTCIMKLLLALGARDGRAIAAAAHNLAHLNLDILYLGPVQGPYRSFRSRWLVDRFIFLFVFIVAFAQSASVMMSMI